MKPKVIAMMLGERHLGWTVSIPELAIPHWFPEWFQAIDYALNYSRVRTSLPYN